MNLIKSLFNSMFWPFCKARAIIVELLDIHEIDVNEIVKNQMIFNLHDDLINNEYSFEQLRSMWFIAHVFNKSDETKDKILKFTKELERFCSENFEGKG